MSELSSVLKCNFFVKFKSKFFKHIQSHLKSSKTEDDFEMPPTNVFKLDNKLNVDMLITMQFYFTEKK